MKLTTMAKLPIQSSELAGRSVVEFGSGGAISGSAIRHGRKRCGQVLESRGARGGSPLSELRGWESEGGRGGRSWEEVRERGELMKRRIKLEF